MLSPDPSTLDVALSDDNQNANKADMHVTMEKPMTKPPAPEQHTDIIGVISEYTPDPFMFTMTKGELPAAKSPQHRKACKKRRRQEDYEEESQPLNITKFSQKQPVYEAAFLLLTRPA